MSLEPGGGVMDEIKRLAAKLASYFAFARWLWDDKKEGLTGLSAGYPNKAAATDTSVKAPTMGTQVEQGVATPLVGNKDKVATPLVENNAATPLVENKDAKDLKKSLEEPAVPLVQAPHPAAATTSQDPRKQQEPGPMQPMQPRH